MGKNANPNLLFDYNAMGQQTMRLPAKPGTEDDWNQERRTSWTYTVDGQKSSMTDYRGGVTTWQYDLHDNIVKAYDPAGSRSLVGLGGRDQGRHVQRVRRGDRDQLQEGHRGELAASRRSSTTRTAWSTVRLENGERDGNGVADQGAEARRADLRPERLHDPSAEPRARRRPARTTSAPTRRYFDTGWEQAAHHAPRCRRLRRRLRRRGSCGRRRAGRTSTTASCSTLTTKDGDGRTTEAHDVGYFEQRGGTRTATGSPTATCS